MESILHDDSKFKVLGPVCSDDNTAKLESRSQRRLLKLHKNDLFLSGVYEGIRSTGSLRPGMYEFPKTHKKDVPQRFFLSMIGSSQHRLAKWLTSVLDPVLSLYSTYCTSDFFTFVDNLRNSGLSPLSVFLCSFDVSSLFTDVLLAETIEICADALYNSDLTPTPFPRNILGELMETATRSVELSFNNITHKQIDGVAMDRAGTTTPEPPGRGGGGAGLVRGPALNTAAFFLLGNDFNTCYDATLIFVCVCVCVERS